MALKVSSTAYDMFGDSVTVEIDTGDEVRLTIPITEEMLESDEAVVLFTKEEFVQFLAPLDLPFKENTYPSNTVIAATRGFDNARIKLVKIPGHGWTAGFGPPYTDEEIESDFKDVIELEDPLA